MALEVLPESGRVWMGKAETGGAIAGKQLPEALDIAPERHYARRFGWLPQATLSSAGINQVRF